MLYVWSKNGKMFTFSSGILSSKSLTEKIMYFNLTAFLGAINHLDSTMQHFANEFIYISTSTRIDPID